MSGTNWTGAPAECVLLQVKVQREDQTHLPMTAVAVVNDWAVTRHLSKPGRFVVTHVPSGLKTGPDLTERDALRTVAKLVSIQVRSTAELAAAAEAIKAAHPSRVQRYWTGTAQPRTIETYMDQLAE